MTVADIERFFEEWAPRWTAWERDNVGLQVGDRSRRVRGILIALDVTEEVIAEAIARRVDLIVSHHPLLFRPPSSITASDAVGRHILSLAEHKVALFSAHTNLDFARGGVSFALAEALGLINTRFLSPLKGSLVKLAVFVPEEYVDRVADAMAQAGGGIIGNYTSCSFRIRGTGTFRGSEETKPFLGKAQRLEAVDEVRLEMILPRASVQAVTAAMKSAHPYEEAAYDIYSLENPNPNFGMGALGELSKKVSLRSFLSRTKRALHAESVRYVGSLRQGIRTVAVCGGSGSDLVDEAIAAKADAFVTADVRYHTYHSAKGRIALVDAGHWETEHIILPSIQRRLRDFTRRSGETIKVFISQHATNPTHCLS
jgi:dinuclear metal center YbgI/SA1388 family protein